MSPRQAMLVGAVTFVALSGAMGLWAYLGTTIFFETIRTGFVACFG